jgi:hypothetical protein
VGEIEIFKHFGWCRGDFVCTFKDFKTERDLEFANSRADDDEAEYNFDEEDTTIDTDMQSSVEFGRYQ